MQDLQIGEDWGEKIKYVGTPSKPQLRDCEQCVYYYTWTTSLGDCFKHCRKKKKMTCDMTEAFLEEYLNQYGDCPYFKEYHTGILSWLFSKRHEPSGITFLMGMSIVFIPAVLCMALHSKFTPLGAGVGLVGLIFFLMWRWKD